MTNVQSTEVLQVDPAPPLIELIGRSSELVGEGRRKVIRMLDGMRHLLVADVFTIAGQDVCPCQISEGQACGSAYYSLTYRGWQEH